MNPETWRYIFDAIEDPMFLHDAEYHLLLANRAYFREAGVTGAEALGKPYWEVFPPGTGPLPGCKRGLDEDLDESHKEVSVGDRLFLSKGCQVHDDQGKLRFALHILSDITARKQQNDRVFLLNQRLQQLVETIQKLALARDLESIIGVACSAARSLIGSDGSTFVLREGDQCFYADEDAIRPLWKGQRFPMSTCISGWVMINHQPAAIEDIYAEALIPASAYRPTFVKSLAMVPIRSQDSLGAIGNYWAHPYLPTPEEMQLLQTLADATAIAMENVRLFDELKQHLAERKEVEALLRDSEQRSRQIIQTSMDGIWIVDTVGRILEVNDAYCRMSGYSRDELLAMRIADVEANERPEKIVHHIREIMTKDCDRFETRHRRKDGQLLDLEVSVVYRPDQEDGCFFGFLHDITARKRMETVLYEKERLLKSVETIAQVGGWEFDVRTGKGTWTEEVARIHGMDPAAETSREIGVGFYQGESRQKIEAAIREAIESGTFYDLELEMVTANGDRKWVRTIGQPVKEGDTVVKLRGSFQDITGRKRAEKALRAAMFALTVAEERERRAIAVDLHDDPGQLLAAANLKLSGLRRETDKAKIANAIAESREFIGQAQRSLRTLIFQVSPPVLFEHGLVPALLSLIETVQRVYGITVSLHDDDNAKPLDQTVRTLVFRAVRELVINVAKHAKVKTADVDVRCGDGQLIVSVTDYGIGFDPNNIGNINLEGGFGLPSIRDRLGFVGGKLEIDSVPGDGTVATLSVPLPDEECHPRAREIGT